MPVSGASWQSLNTAVATVDQTGKVTVTGTAGSANIVATLAPYDPAYGAVVVAHATGQTVQVSSSLVKSATPTSAVLVRNAQTQALLPGNIVVSGSTGALFGQITGVQMDASNVTLSLQSTTIPAAFPDYSYTWNGPPVQLTVQSAPGRRYIVTDKRGRVISEGPVEYRCSVTAITMTEPPSFSYPVTWQPIFRVDLPHRIVQIGGELSGSISFSGGKYATTGSLDSPASCFASINLPSHVQFAVPGTLLTAAPALTPSVGFELMSDRSVTVVGPSAGANFDIVAGFQYQNGQWSLLPGHGPPTWTPGQVPQIPSDGSLGVTLSPFFKAEVGFDVCPFVCITTPFNNTLLNANVAYGKLAIDYNLTFAGPTNELEQGYHGPVLSTSAKAEGGVEFALDFAALDGLLHYINITPFSVDKKLGTLATSPIVTPSIRVGGDPTSIAAGNAVTLTASASGNSATGVRFIGFRNGAAGGSVLASSTLDGRGNASAKWTPSAAGQYSIVAVVDNVVGRATASTNSVAVAVAAAPQAPQPTPVPPVTPQPTPVPPVTPQPTPVPPVTPQPTPVPPVTPQPTPIPPVTPQPTPVPPVTPQPTPVPPVTPQPTPMPPATKVATVANTGGAGLHLRNAPGINSSIVTTLLDGTQTTVIGGPTVMNGFTWWNIRATVNGVQYSGWGGIGEWLAPPPNFGSIVTVSYTSGFGLNLHAGTSKSSTVVKALPEGAQMTVIGGPVAAEGYIWWNIRGYVGGSQYTGWSALADWLVPNPRY